MGKETGIQWTTHTFNPWRGCVKISPGCTNCYAETQSHRNPAVLGEWGLNANRVIGAESYWKQPIAWNRAAVEAVYRYSLEERQAGKHLATRPRVFCASLADVFEDRPDLVAPRARLFRLIDSTPFLDWLLLTKRPENISKLFPENPNIEEYYGELTGVHVEGRDCDGMEGDCCWGSGWLPSPPFPVPSKSYRPNVWLMTTVESSDYLPRIDYLLGNGSKVPILGLSIEPLLGPMPTLGEHLDGIDWVIAGGESGASARPMHPDWARSIRDQCAALEVPYFFKQWGEWVPEGQAVSWLSDAINPRPLMRIDAEGRDVSGLPGLWDDTDATLRKVGKKHAGRLLDGHEHNEFPTVHAELAH